MRKAFIVATTGLVVFMTSCSSVTPTQTQNKAMTNAIEQNREQPQSREELGESFNPPHFLPRSFTVACLPDGSLNLTMNYVISEQLYGILRDKPTYYLVIGFPQSTVEITSLQQTAPLLVPKLGNTGQRSFTVSFSEKIPKSISSRDKQLLEENLVGYELTVLDERRKPVHIYDDIYYLTKYVVG